MSVSKRVKLVGAAQSLIAGITDALRTATIDHSKVFEVMALLSVMADTISGKTAGGRGGARLRSMIDAEHTPRVPA